MINLKTGFRIDAVPLKQVEAGHPYVFCIQFADGTIDSTSVTATSGAQTSIQYPNVPLSFKAGSRDAIFNLYIDASKNGCSIQEFEGGRTFWIQADN